MCSVLLVVVAILFCPFSVLSDSDQEVNVNEQIDQMLIDLRNSIIYDGKDILPLDDFEDKFEKRVSRWVKAKGSFKATGGSVRYLSSVQRTGDATLSSTPTSATFTLHLGFGHMEVYYDKYRASFLSARVSGDVRLTVRRFSILIAVTLQLNDDECKAILDTSTVEYLDGIDVEISGLGPLNWAFEKISELMILRYKNDIQYRLQGELTEKLKIFMTKQYVCDVVYYF
uniref:Lipid-binding serum glycoprotein N-terminal domain-containing protein n=1 Tax=Homalodisca liturata TaxID=320908 RepID=A0A1B6IN91_9HEMI